MLSRWLLTPIILLVPTLVAVGLVFVYVSPAGTRTVSYRVDQKSPFVQRLLPDARVGAVEGTGDEARVELLDEPVYFTVTPPPGDFSQVTITTAFDPGGTPLFEIGGLADVAAQSFDFKPVSNDLLENLDWTRHELATGLTLFSRDPQGQVYKTFLQAPPPRDAVAVYKADFPTPYRLAGYTPLGANQTFAVSLRGPHELQTYIKNEPFSLEMSYTDVNRTFGVDDGFVRVVNERNELMTEFVLRDDGNTYDNQMASMEKTITLKGNNWPEGVYTVSVSGTSDIMWRSIATGQRYLVVKNRVFVGDDVGYLPTPRATTLYTNAKRLTFETQHAEGLQTVSVGKQTAEIKAVGEKYSTSVLTPGILPVMTPVSDVKVTGEGKYAFSAESFFDPDPVVLTAFTNLATTGVDYVLANVPATATAGEWRTASATFATSALAQENGAYKFALSAPGLHDNLGTVAIHGFTLTFSREDTSSRSWLRQLRHAVKLLLP